MNPDTQAILICLFSAFIIICFVSSVVLCFAPWHASTQRGVPAHHQTTMNWLSTTAVPSKGDDVDASLQSGLRQSQALSKPQLSCPSLHCTCYEGNSMSSQKSLAIRSMETVSSTLTICTGPRPNKFIHLWAAILDGQIGKALLPRHTMGYLELLINYSKYQTP